MDRHTPQLVYQRPLTFSERRRVTIAALALVSACAFGWFVRTPIEQATKAGYGQAQQINQETRTSTPRADESVPGRTTQPVNP